MDIQLNDHLKIDGDGRTLFYPVGFTSPGYLVPDEALKKRILWLHRLHRLSSYIAASFGLLVISAIESRYHFAWALLGGLLAIYFVERPLRAWWPRYTASLASRLMRVDD